MPTTSASLRIADVTKRFGDVVAVDAINVDIPSGEFLTLLGPSGSGKTTTLLMIAGFEEPSEGSIDLDGRPVTGIPSYRRGFGMVFQNYALFPHMTVSDNVGFPLKMRKIRGKEQAQLVERALELVRLPGYGGRYPNQLSGGQQQRVALARALVFNPPVLLMDEPLGALDKKLREEMQLEIKRIQSELGITTIYVTHDQEEALVMSDRIAVMNLGRIEQIDTPANLYEHPATRFVADFIGESNLIPITLRQDNGASRAEAPGQHLLHYRADGTSAVAGPTSLVVRPEKVRLGEDAAGLDNQLTGTVSEVIYVGDTTRYRITIGDDFELTVKRHNRAGQEAIGVADSVRVGWGAGDGSLV